MKDIDYYMGLSYRVEIVREEAEDGYVLSLPELKGCLTCAADLEQGMAMLDDAKKEWIRAALDNGYEIPEPLTAESYSGQFKLRIPKSLHKDLAEESRRQGVSMNQYCVYLLSQRHNGSMAPKHRTKSKPGTRVNYTP